MRRNSDLGGQAAGPIDRTEVPVQPWQHRLDAMRRVLGDKKRHLITLDEMRRAIEDLPPEKYHGMAFFDRRMLAVETILVEKGVVCREEIDAAVTQIMEEAGSRRARDAKD